MLERRKVQQALLLAGALAKGKPGRDLRSVRIGCRTLRRIHPYLPDRSTETVPRAQFDGLSISQI